MVCEHKYIWISATAAIDLPASLFVKKSKTLQLWLNLQVYKKVYILKSKAGKAETAGMRWIT